jgi:hypothetical protein
MKLEELILMYRAQSHDEAVPYLCSDELLTIYANEAQDEACRRGDLLRSSTADFCNIAFLAGDETVELDERIVRIKRATVDGYHLQMVSAERMDEIFPNWTEDQTRARPSHLIEGMETGLGYLWPRPRDNGTLKMTVQRLPMCPLAGDFDEPEIRRELHPCLVDWMLYRAYSREDTEMYNPQSAGVALGRFIAEFGEKKSGRNEAWSRTASGVQPPPIA